MTDTTGIEKYSATARVLHWAISVLVILQFILAWTADSLPEEDERIATLMLTHKSIGMTVLALAVIRLVWRFLHKPPAFPASMSVAEQRLAAVTHWALYLLIFLMPLSGWLMSSSAGRSTQWFGLFAFPDLVGKNRPAFDFFHEAHELLAWVLFALALFHILAALWHVFVKKDGLLKRMA